MGASARAAEGARHYVAGMDWFDQFKDVLGVALATLAIALSLVTVFMQRQQHQRDAYRQMYETLMSDDLHRGRWLINEVSTASNLPDDPADVRLIHRTLGTFENLAMYVRHGVVPRTWVMDVWHHPLRDMRRGAETVRASQRAQIGSSGAYWPELWRLFDQAETYHSNLPCCRLRDNATEPPR